MIKLRWRSCILLVIIFSGDKIEKNEMSWACSVYGGEERHIDTGFWFRGLREETTWETQM